MKCATHHGVRYKCGESEKLNPVSLHTHTAALCALSLSVSACFCLDLESPPKKRLYKKKKRARVCSGAQHPVAGWRRLI